MMPFIVGISGVRGAGKSLLGNYLEELGFEKLSLADWLKREAMSKFSLRSSQVYGNEKEVPTQYVRTDGSPLTGRDILIRMGVFYRSVDPLFFCKKMDQFMQNGRSYVIDDIRFNNEIQYFKSHYGARFARIERAQELNVYKAALDDASETELNAYLDWDWKLEAAYNQTPADLERFASVINASYLPF